MSTFLRETLVHACNMRSSRVYTCMLVFICRCIDCLINFANSLKEVRVRFVGFGAEEDEWVNIKQAVRERSVPLEHSECQKVKVGDLVLCFQVTIDAKPFGRPVEY